MASKKKKAARSIVKATVKKAKQARPARHPASRGTKASLPRKKAPPRRLAHNAAKPARTAVRRVARMAVRARTPARKPARKSAGKLASHISRKPVRKAVPAAARKAIRNAPRKAVKVKILHKRKEKDAFEERIASKKPVIPTGPDPMDVAKITAILADSRVRQMLIELGGENALAIIRNFYGNHSDEEMSKRLKLKISDVRATLNKLHNEGLVNYIREKDSDTGWYSYSWSLNIMRMERWAGAQSLKPGDLAGSQYYFCPSCGESSIINFDSAAEDDFRCERCNKLLDFIDEKKLGELIAGKK